MRWAKPLSLVFSLLFAALLVVMLGSGLVGEVSGVLLVRGDTLDNPELTLTRGAKLGAAVGTIVIPRVGTGAGAKLGNRIG